jgi:hypothetical protein
MRKTTAVLPLLALLAAGRSWAQTGGTVGTVSGLAAADFTFNTEYYDTGSHSWVQMNTTQKSYFFNRARCECADPKVVADPDYEKNGGNYAGYFKIAIQPATNTSQKISTLLATNGVPLGDGRLYAGSNGVDCLSPGGSPGVVAGACTNLLNPTSAGYAQSFPLTEFVSKRLYESPPIAVSTLFGSLTACGPKDTCGSISTCSTSFSTQTIFFWARTTGQGYPDTTGITFTLNLNGELQYGPTGVSVRGGNNALMVDWTWATGLTPSADANFLGVQVFCKRGASNQVFPEGSFGASFKQSGDICPAVAPVIEAPSAFSNLSPLYLCSGLLPSTATTHRITGLQNGIWYGVAVAAVDKYGNVTDIAESSVKYGQPIPTVDFYTEYREAGGTAQGGFCSLGGWKQKSGAMTLAGFLVLGLIVVGRRRRKGPPSATMMVLLVAASTLAAGQARAQNDPDDAVPADDSETEEPAPPPRVWAGTERDFAFELRFGMYMPNVDSEFAGSKLVNQTETPPNQFLFGNSKRPMWQIEFDWEVLQMFGTLSVGASIGYWKENGSACLRSDLPAKCSSSADNTSLRLIPFAALLVYRLDEAAKRWKIPLVPYGKIGLNYTIWTVNDADGNVPNYPKGGRGQGGTPGWQAAVGLSLQLDFIDPSAAREFDAESGVNHTYAFFELDHVDSSGLYRNDVLQVGDNTWFTGLMFEF